MVVYYETRKIGAQNRGLSHGDISETARTPGLLWQHIFGTKCDQNFANVGISQRTFDLMRVHDHSVEVNVGVI